MRQHVAKKKMTAALLSGAAIATCIGLFAGASGASAEVAVQGGGQPTPEAEGRRAPAYIFPDFHEIAAQPSPSEVNPAWFGPVLLMHSAQIDLEHGTARLPLRHGRLRNGKDVWFVITDVSDENIANLHGINYSPKMAYADGMAARHATIEKDGTWVFDKGSVDFSPNWQVVPGPAANPFPPKVAHPGSVGDADYTPLVHIDSSAKSLLFNAPVLSMATTSELNAMCDGTVDHSKVHDKVVAICPRDGYVTMSLTLGMTFNKPVLYLSTEANDPTVASLETATYAPALKALPFVLEDSSPGEAAERIIVVVNGATGIDNPQRQGLYSALTDGRGPLNVLGGIPTINLDYSPMWRLFPAVWTQDAILKGYRSRISSAPDAGDLAARGLIKSLDGGEFRAVGFVVNCPVVYRIN